MNALRIVFFGTPEFAEASLEAIHKSSPHQVVGVVTIPDKPAGRGLKVSESLVKKFALQMQVPILQPEKLKNETFISDLRKLQADIFIVIAFRILPQEVWAIPPKGTVNLHGSLLPQYRGAAPINRAVMNGEKRTGVTTFFINEHIDTGAVLMNENIEIFDDEDAGSLHDRMKVIGAGLLLKTLDAIAENNIRPLLQSEMNMKEPLHKAPKIFRSDCLIEWRNDAKFIYNQIRGLSPYPAAFTYLENAKGEKKSLKIFKVKISQEFRIEQGEILFTSNKQLLIGTNDNSLEIIELQVEGKRKMSVVDFLNGFDILEYKISN
ncbi:MAG: methionyl-tRNA formyltransferase [Bacteroidales bacterium]|jgi:methionyl-tRNA formyltransferase|nr:methionyl-tRNA formyltransferase [Bacteroidales bacterium]